MLKGSMSNDDRRMSLMHARKTESGCNKYLKALTWKQNIESTYLMYGVAELEERKNK